MRTVRCWLKRSTPKRVPTSLVLLALAVPEAIAHKVTSNITIQELCTLRREKTMFAKRLAHRLGRAYCHAICRSEFEAQAYKRTNERPIELRFAFECITDTCPKTILDVGTGLSPLPALIRSCGMITSAVDNVRDYWGKDMFNRHFYVRDEDATRGLSGTFDLVTCISVLEHIPQSDAAVKNMLAAVAPGGHLVLTHPYNENFYCPNAYKLPEAGYGQDASYVCQIYSRRELDRWFSEPGIRIVRQEYWQVFSGEHWTVGEWLRPPLRVTNTDRHHLTCLLIRRGQ
jgi:SAM-dependent methyltransferase